MLRLALAYKRFPIATKMPKVCQENIPYTITPPPPACTVVTRHVNIKLRYKLAILRKRC